MLRAHYTRVAVVQLAFHPAALVERASPREDPLYDASAPRSSLLPGDGQFPRALAEDLKDLKARIREPTTPS